MTKETLMRALRTSWAAVTHAFASVGTGVARFWRWVIEGLPIARERTEQLPGRPRVRLPRLQARKRPAVDQVNRRKLAIDFGTSSCAVAVQLGAPDEPPEVATLSVEVVAPHAPRKTIGSATFIGNDDDVLVMDEGWINRYLLKQGAQGVTYRSIKRELFEHYHLTDAESELLKQRLSSIYEELLWLALDPSQSSTVRALKSAGFDQAVKAWTQQGGFLLTVNDRSMKDEVTINGFDVCICVPNSLMPKDVDVLIGAARRAAANVLSRLRENREDEETYEPSVITIREAEAVAWALPRRDLMPELRGDVVILDVGAGTSDAALVSYGRLEGGENLVEFRTGAPFGGDDLDMLLLCEAAAELERTPPAGFTPVPLPKLSRAEKNALIEKAREQKELWVSGSPADSVTVTIPGGGDPAPAIQILNPADANVPYYGAQSNGGTPQMQSVPVPNPHSAEAYRAFLRYTVFLSCAALFRRLQGQSVSAIVLTGQASLALGIRPYVAALAQHYAITVPADAVLHLDPIHSEAMKLVCVEGAATYASELGKKSQSVGNIVPETFVLLHDFDRMDLFPAGSRSQLDHVNAIVALQHPHVNRHVFHYYCSPQDLLPSDLTRDWARKTLGSIVGDSEWRALAFRLDLKKEQIDVWALDLIGTLAKVRFQPAPVVRGRKLEHPFLKIGNHRLPLTWQSGG